MKILLFANTDWYLYNFRRSLALALQSAGHEVLLVSPAGAYGEKLEDLGLRWMAVPMRRRSLNPLRELALVNWLRSLIVHEAVDLVHGFTIKCAVYGSLAARWTGRGSVNAVAGLGYVFTSHDWQARVLRPLVSTVLRFALNTRQSRLILQNPDDVALFRDRLGVDPQRIRLIPGSGVDCVRFAPSGTAPGTRAVRVLLAGRLLWDKGIQEFVDAARLLMAQGRPIQFLLAGAPDDGNPGAVPVDLLQDWTKEGTILWMGHVGDMAALYRTVDIVVLPSYREGLPKGLIEAAACGLALVTTDVPGCREVVTHELDGLIVPARDAEALAGAMARLQDDVELRIRLGQAARSKACECFEEKAIVGQTLEVYREIVPMSAEGHEGKDAPSPGAPLRAMTQDKGKWL